MSKDGLPLSRALLCLRSAHGWSQRDLAAAAGVSPSLLSDYECGRKALSVRRLKALVAPLGLDLTAVDQALTFLEEIHRPRRDTLDRLRLAEARRALAAVLREEGAGGPPPASAAPASTAPAAGGSSSAPIPPPLRRPAAAVERDQRRLLVGQLRLLRGWTQKQLAAAAGVAASSISDYERGASVPTRNTIERLATATGVSAPLLVQIGVFVSVASAGLLGSPAQPLAPPAAAGAARCEVSVPDAAERRQAAQFWSGLAARTAGERRAEIERNPAEVTWALCELLCAESVKAGIESPPLALELAGLAWRTAELCKGSTQWQTRLLGYARAHHANALRTAGDLPAAESELGTAKRLWAAGSAAGQGPLNGTKIASFEVSLLLRQGRLEQALETVDRALETPHSQELPALLVLKMTVLSDLGRHRLAVGVARQAEAVLDPRADPRLAACARTVLVWSLCDSGRHRRAESLLALLRQDVLKLGNELDLIRLDYTEGKVAAAGRELQKAIEIFAEVRGAFLARNLEYDAAWAAARLSQVLWRSGRMGEARRVARQAETAFHDAGLSREVAAHALALDPVRG